MCYQFFTKKHALCVLHKDAVNESISMKHFQEPNAPFPYQVHEVTFTNESANITLSGTLTKPSTHQQLPAVILIAGMGPVDRDGNMFGHKLYLVLADYLTRQGIAVLRFDKRGVAKSTGSFGPQVTTRDLADDVLAGIGYLKNRDDIDPKRIGLVGVSEGGLITSMLAGQSDDVAFAVCMAPAIANSPEVLAQQIATQLRMDGASDELINAMRTLTADMLTIVRDEQDPLKAEQLLHEKATQVLHALPESLQQEAERYPFATSLNNMTIKIQVFNSPWYRWILKQDMHAILSAIKVPLLVLYGEHDFMAPHLMVPIITQAVHNTDNDQYTIMTLPKLNHAFQTCTTGALSEYATLEETIAPSVLDLIGNWVNKQI